MQLGLGKERRRVRRRVPRDQAVVVSKEGKTRAVSWEEIVAGSVGAGRRVNGSVALVVVVGRGRAMVGALFGWLSGWWAVGVSAVLECELDQ